MKALFLNPPALNGKNLSIDPILSRCSGVPAKAPYLWPPIGLAYLAAYAREKTSAKISILDAQALGLSEKETVKKTARQDLVFFNASTPSIERDLGLCSKISENNPKIALLGPHAEQYWNELLHNDFVDFVVTGEPEKPVKNLINAVENNKVENAEGIAWKKSGKPMKNKPSEPIKDLDSLPFAARDLLPKKGYYDILAMGEKQGFVISSRGCPFKCRFCSAGMHSQGFRARSAENVLEEISEMKEKGVDGITFLDDSFTIDKKRVFGVSQGLKELGVNWRCLSRTDTVDKKLLREMHGSGCYQAMFGVESGSQKMLDRMRKQSTLETTRKTFGHCNELGIETVAFFVFGFPGETIESIQESIDFAKELNADFASFNSFTPFPGSEIFEEFNHSKLNWGDYDFTSTSFCKIPTSELRTQIKNAYRAFYFRPGYLADRIKKSGVKRTIKQNIDFWAKKEGVLWQKGIK